MNNFSDLWKYRKEPIGRINITLFFINVFLLFIHLAYMLIYVYVKAKVMIYLNILSILLYTFYTFYCVKFSKHYSGIVMLEIWIHMLFAMLTFGWQASFQNWTFAILIAVFLPIFNKRGETNVTIALIFSSILIFSYYLFAILIKVVDYPVYVDFSSDVVKVLFFSNNLIVFLSIIMITMFYTLTASRRTRELSRKADFDELTNLYNRHSLSTVGCKIAARAREASRDYSVAILDIDFFKKVNDKYGHTSGDLVLKEVANIIRMFSFKDIKPGRWGGEEFVIICPHTTSYLDFTNSLELLRQKIEKTPFVIEGDKKIKITVSIGSVVASNNLTLEEAVSLADENLYKAKESGRNRLIK